MISALVFSRDRPAQLDLLLQSLRERAPEIYEKTAALFRPTESQYEQGFSLCASYHPAVTFIRERDFQAQVLDWLPSEECAMFLCDDDVLYRPLPESALFPDECLASSGWNPAESYVLCFSLRLGRNTTFCYPLRKTQIVPIRHYPCRWSWEHAEGDFGYPGSLDGNVWRVSHLRRLISANHPTWTCPNELEDHLNRSCQTALLPFMQCYSESVLVGLPLNSVQDVYKPNRHAETHRAPLLTLNARFLEGRRLSLDSVIASKVDAAHCEVKLLWQPELVTA